MFDHEDAIGSVGTSIKSGATSTWGHPVDLSTIAANTFAWDYRKAYFATSLCDGTAGASKIDVTATRGRRKGACGDRATVISLG